MTQPVDFTLLTAIAQRARKVQLKWFDNLQSAQVESKQGDERDLLTIADSETERVIIETIREHCPEHSILAEESGDMLHESPYCWIIDPVDGTTNFARSFPFFAASVALCKHGQPVLALVEAPRLGETFMAAKGKGAFLNGQRIQVSSTPDIAHSILATGFAYVRNQVQRNNVDNFSSLVLQAHDIRRAGAASLDLAYVAAGRFDGHWEPYLKPWDVAAGALLVTEAGGKMSDFAGGDDWLFSENAVATNGQIHDELLSNLSGTEQGRPRWGIDLERQIRSS
ncbi:inositol monophosphatase family protein [Planctomycetota bacterium]|nr:inositol monophosphatase family protein [Planctomycetota bacterium]